MSQVIENSYVLAEEKDRSSLSPLSKLLTSNEKVANDLEARSDERASRLTQWMIISGSQYLSSAIFAIVHGLIFTYGFRKSYTGADLTVVRSTFGSTLPIANAAALVLYFDLAILVFPVCQTFISLYSRTPLSAVIAFDGNSHRVVAHYLICFTWVHTTAHWTHFAQLAKKHNTGFNGFLIINLFTGPGWSGHIMLIVLMLMVVTSFKGLRQGSFQRFYYIHHLFVIFFVVLSIHGGFCMIRLDTAPGGTPFCAKCGSLWQWLMYGGLGWLLGERIMGEVRGRYKTHISKVIRHPANVVEIQVKKENTTTNIGQVRSHYAMEITLLINALVHIC